MTIPKPNNNVALAPCVLFSELLTQGATAPCCQNSLTFYSAGKYQVIPVVPAKLKPSETTA